MYCIVELPICDAWCLAMYSSKVYEFRQSKYGSDLVGMQSMYSSIQPHFRQSKEVLLRFEQDMSLVWVSVWCKGQKKTWQVCPCYHLIMMQG